MSEEENKGGEEGLIPLNPPPVEKPNLLGYATVLLLIPLLFTSSLLYFIEGYNKFIQAEEQAPQYFLSLFNATSPTSRVDDALVDVTYVYRYISDDFDDIDDPNLYWPISIFIITGEGLHYSCGLRGFDDNKECLITEHEEGHTAGERWTIGEAITLSENGVDICSARCDFIVRVYTPDGVVEANINW